MRRCYRVNPNKTSTLLEQKRSQKCTHLVLDPGDLEHLEQNKLLMSQDFTLTKVLHLSAQPRHMSLEKKLNDLSNMNNSIYFIVRKHTF